MLYNWQLLSVSAMGLDQSYVGKSEDKSEKSEDTHISDL